MLCPPGFSLFPSLASSDGVDLDMTNSVLGVFRNRTSKFVEFRATYRSMHGSSPAGVGFSSGGDTHGLLNRDGEVELTVIDSKTPHWVSVVDAIHKGLETIKQKSMSPFLFAVAFCLPYK